MSRPYDNPTYKRNRATILQGQPLCHWCGRQQATEADHLTSLDDGGGHELDNLVPSCKPCNARRGAHHVNRKTATTTQRRNEALTRSGVFGLPETPTPSPRSKISPRTSDRGESGPFEDYRHLLGRTEPRLESPGIGSSSLGPALVDWARSAAGIDLLPWQERALSGQLALTDDGSFMFSRAVVSTGRQQGKSFAMRALLAWWLVEESARRGEAQNVLLMANKLARTKPMFLQLADLLRDRFGAKVRLSNGDSSVTMPDGSQLVIAAARPNFHGGTWDLICLDELWDIAQEVVFDALLPSQIARPDSLLSAWSTAGDESSTAFLRWREQAIADIDANRTSRLYFAEWSPPPGVDAYGERKWWPWANPSLGHFVTWDKLDDASRSPDRASFLRAHLNTWVASARPWLPAGIWDRQATDLPMPPGGVVAFDQSVDESRYVGVRAASSDHGVQVAVEFVVDREEDAWTAIGRVMEDPNVKLAVTPSLELHVPLPLRRRTTTVGHGEILKYTNTVRSMIAEGRLWHSPSDALLAEHVNRAVAYKTQNAVGLSSKTSPGPIELARCLVFAASLASKPVAVGKAAFGKAH